MLTLPVFFFFASPGLLDASVHLRRPHRILMDPLMCCCCYFLAHLYIFCVITLRLSSMSWFLCATPPRPVCVFVFVCVLLCVPALLLNNPGYHVVLSADRNGSRPLVAPSRAPAQEKSLNVPQGKRRQSGPGESGDASSVSPQPWSPFCTCLTFIVTHYS